MKLSLLALAPALAAASTTSTTDAPTTDAPTTDAPTTDAPTPAGPTVCEESPNTFGCTPTGFCAGAEQVDELDPSICEEIGEAMPCYSWNLLIATDCNGVEGNPCTWIGDGYCDDGTFFGTDFNCAANDYDDGDCELIYDCDGNLALANLLEDGTCHSGDSTIVNFDCLAYDYDGGDCAPKNCDGSCIDEYPETDGTCQEDFNCKKFEYSFGECAPKNICPDDWYDMGRENYRCSQRTGGNRYASKRVDPFDECECYEFCQGKAEEYGVVMTAFDHYSDKCRCWEGECTDRSLIQCKADGVNADDFSGTDGRCPSATYFPHERVEDCHPEGFVQDVTMYAGYFWENYYNDGYCDNAQYGTMDYTEYDWGEMPIGDYDCATFNDDGEDCLAATCDQIFQATQFAALDEPNMVCDGHDNEVTKETEWTTACDCYEFCAPDDESVEVMFQRNNHGMCQCLSHCDSQSNCGLESDCQIFYVDRIFDCCGDDWTLGKISSEIDPDTLGEFYSRRVVSLQESQRQSNVISYDYLETISSREGFCVPEFMCVEFAYSFGEVDGDGDIVSSPCFECLVQTQEQLDNYTIPDTRCDMSSNDGIRYLQLKDYYAIGSGRTPFDLDDYCACEVACRLAKFEFYATGTCAAVSGMQGYDEWLADPSTAFAVDSYKGDCRCWDYCTPDTVWTCTVGVVNRCVEPVAVLLWDNPGQPIDLPPVRPNGGTP
jgi:hypothetical protein